MRIIFVSILWMQMLRVVLCFTYPFYITRELRDVKISQEYSGLNMLKLRGAAVSKYNEYNREYLKKSLLEESRSSIPDSSKIEEISQILRRQSDFRGDVEDIMWDVIYPREDNISIDWVIKKTDKETFFKGTPDNIRETIESSFKPLESNVSKLMIRRIEIIDTRGDIVRIKNNIRRLKIRTRRWALRNRQMCIGRFIMYMIRIAGCMFDNRKRNRDMIQKINIMMYGVYSNPVLKNFYHIPYKKENKKRNYSITDNNIIYADDEMIVLENSWLRYEDDDIYALPVMICIKKK